MTVCKVISKLLVIRYNKIFPKIISPILGAFIKGCWIVENSVIAYKLFHKFLKHKGKYCLMLLKMNMHKAYDHMEWPFIMKAIEHWRFSIEVRRLIFSYVSSIGYKLLVNNILASDITPSLGFRQGDPLSSYLFIICSDVLSRLVENKIGINGIQLCNTEPLIAHLLYTENFT